MNKTLKRKFAYAFVLLLALSFAFGILCAFGCGEPPAPEVKVKSVKIAENPAKTEYYVGDVFDISGGKIAVEYSDGSSEVLDMSAEGVTVSEVMIAVSGDDDSEEKTVTVRYGGKSARFKINVSHKYFKLVYDYGYEGATNTENRVRKGSKATEPEKPVRSGYTFENWFADADFTEVFDFAATEINEDTTIYAMWTANAAVYFEVKFDCNYAGAPSPSKQKVKENELARRPADPKRYGFEFLGWHTDAACENVYDFASASVTGALTLYAKWNRTLPAGIREYVFEAEDTNLAGKKGPGMSGTTTATAMIQTDDGTLGASNERFIGYQYANGCSIEFGFISDVAVDDAKIVLRFSAELRDYLMTPASYKIMLNGTSLNYPQIAFTGVPASSLGDAGKISALAFADYVIAENVSLRVGFNSVILQTSNNHPLEGTTIEADAPLIDCLKITTSAILEWSAADGLPKTDNYE